MAVACSTTRLTRAAPSCGLCVAVRRSTTFPSQHQSSRRNTRSQAYVEASVSLAVTQQTIAYAVILAAEAAYTRSQPTDSSAGLPEVLPVAVAVAAVAAVVPLVNIGGAANTVGLAVGLVASAVMLLYNAKRTNDTPQDGSTWPGPKAWPATIALISFLALNLYIQALRAEL